MRLQRKVTEYFAVKKFTNHENPVINNYNLRVSVNELGAHSGKHRGQMGKYSFLLGSRVPGRKTH